MPFRARSARPLGAHMAPGSSSSLRVLYRVGPLSLLPDICDSLPCKSHVTPAGAFHHNKSAYLTHMSSVCV